MLYKLTIITKNTQHAKWNYTRNSYYLKTSSGLTMENCRMRLDPLRQMFQQLLKTDMIILGILYEGLEDDGKTPNSGFAVYGETLTRGLRTINGQTKYRYALQLNLTTPRGRHGKTWIRGAIDSGDVNETEGNQIALKNREQFGQPLLDIMAPETERLLFDFIPKPDYRNPNTPNDQRKYLGIYVRGVSNAHATTRVRFGINSEGVAILAEMIGAVVLLSKTWFRVNARFVSDGAFTFADVFRDTLQALGTARLISERVKYYFKDADDDPSNEDEPPKTRFGGTCGAIKVAWEFQAEKMLQDLPDLLQVWKPYTDRGDGQDYVTKEATQIYLDLLKDMIIRCAFCVTFDGYNPNAFEGQKPNDGSEDVPEVAKMEM